MSKEDKQRTDRFAEALKAGEDDMSPELAAAQKDASVKLAEEAGLSPQQIEELLGVPANDRRKPLSGNSSPPPRLGKN